MMRVLSIELHITLLAYLAVMVVACLCTLFCGLMLGSAWGTAEIKRMPCGHEGPGDDAANTSTQQLEYANG